ncbi:MAG: hypothetical protein L3J18_01525 [Candidatus Brocadia sp.]|jgi:hypothetical protein|uniref:Uncharacterized protein n=1 Tax=Candidatus Brocadia fulgida TaxID=380242 RepID=A0A0M2UW25_9BACT|nr:MAG: hypothetical protein BROFUL_02149 [Candidatus Brocadia fulgida]UJS21031.1 MAG: hypothetical protein L3J18_01525 [Candidatus Brocadia sp.]
MPLQPEKLRILTFPQRVNDNQLELNVLVLPTQNLLNAQATFNSVLNPGNPVDLPKFIKANLQLEIKTIKGLSTYPFSDATVLTNEGVLADTWPTTLAYPNNLPALYEGLSKQFKLDTSLSGTTKGAGAPLSDADGIRKYLPKSYRTAFNFTTPRTAFAKTDDSYQCAIKRTGKPNPSFQQSKDDITWGRVIAFCLRQPLLARAIGLLHSWTLNLNDPNYFENGGWVYFNLISNLTDFDITNAATELKQYAARIPAIDQPRQLFAAVLFPVVPGPAQPNGQFDLLKIEVADYDDGFAKIVHAVQPVSANLLSEEPDGIHVQKEMGIRLGWDDEQLLIWQNRQFLSDPTTPGQRIDAPLGVFSYRVDVKEKNNVAWNSLVNTQSKAKLTLAGETIAPAGAPVETGVQVYPMKVNADAGAFFWLPGYFTQWYGPSLVLPDTRAAQLDASGALADPGKYTDGIKPIPPEQKGGLYEPLLPEDCELKYGKEYEFRVRFADLTGGGPLVTDNELNDAPASSSSIIFKRYVAPKQLTLKPLTAQPAPDAGTIIFYAGEGFEVLRPRLGYPALLFTEMDTADAFQKLLDDKNFLHTGKLPNETIKDQREVSYFDPDVDKIMVIVEVRTLLMDNLASLTQKEAFIPLYKTFRTFPHDPEEPYELNLEYRDARVIDFGNTLTLGDLNISQTEIDQIDSIVVPTSRDVRITLYPVCSDKEASPAYFGLQKQLIAGELVRTGEPIQFFVRQDATAEPEFFKPVLESKKLQGIYLQPDPVQIINPVSFIPEIVAGKEAEQTTVMQRLAAQLDLDYKGLSLIGKPGERIQFGCSNRIRHTLAPDNSSLSFAASGELFNHWLCVLSYEINRDWTWDGLSDTGIKLEREKQFTNEPATKETEVVGYLELKKTASRIAINDPDRSYTRIVFIDAVEPKKDLDKPATAAQPFPNTIDVKYTLTPQFIKSVSAASANAQITTADVLLPTTVIPKQVPKVVAAGIALSPYRQNDDYSETATRERYLWFEFEAPIEDPNDAYFARVLTYAPDPLLTYPNPDQVLVKQDDPPLSIDPELIRVITKGHGNDNAGIDAMQLMVSETPNPDTPLMKITPVHYLLPLPPGLHNESNELFGFFIYELRVGHTNTIWCTAQGRFGHPARVNGVQHPAPPLKCLVERTNKGIAVTAQYAQAVFNGKQVTARPPRSEIWCMLYAQVKQADGKQNRNILLSEVKLDYVQTAHPQQIAEFLKARASLTLIAANSLQANPDIPLTGKAGWSANEIDLLLDQFHLRGNIGLSVLAVEMMPRYEQFIYNYDAQVSDVRPLSRELGRYRILRTSRLAVVPEICCENCG